LLMSRCFWRVLVQAGNHYQQARPILRAAAGTSQRFRLGIGPQFTFGSNKGLSQGRAVLDLDNPPRPQATMVGASQPSRNDSAHVLTIWARRLQTAWPDGAALQQRPKHRLERVQ
jgi:hypothetical protein